MRLLSLLLFCFSSIVRNTTVATKTTCSDESSEISIQVDKIVDWLVSKGGIFNSNLEFRRSDNENSDGTIDLDSGHSSASTTNLSTFRLFAKGSIQENDVLIKIPLSSIIKTDIPDVGDRVYGNYRGDGEWFLGSVVQKNDHNDNGKVSFDIRYDDGDFDSNLPLKYIRKQKICDVVQTFIKEQDLGSDSDFAPYITYVTSHQQNDDSINLPHSWSDEGKKLLNLVIDNGTLPPFKINDWSYDKECPELSGNIVGSGIAQWVLKYGWDKHALVPLFDMISHSNGANSLNTEESGGLNSNEIVLHASRDIEEGEEIYRSYSHCSGCIRKDEHYDTADFFFDYGFVEQYPQQWKFRLVYHKETKDQDEEEEEDQDNDDTDEFIIVLENDGGGKTEVFWIETSASLYYLDFVRTELRRLNNLVDELKEGQSVVPANELRAVQQYHEALVHAMSDIINDINVKEILNEVDMAEQCLVDDIRDDKSGICLKILETNSIHGLFYSMDCATMFESPRPVYLQSEYMALRKTYEDVIGGSEKSSISPLSSEGGFVVPIEIKVSSKGRGVYAAKKIVKGQHVYSSRQSAIFPEGGLYRKFLKGIPSRSTICDMLQWNYVSYDAEERKNLIHVDLDESSLMNGSNSGEDEDEEMPLNIGFNIHKSRDLPGPWNTHLFATSDIEAGEELLMDYEDFILDAWSEFGF